LFGANDLIELFRMWAVTPSRHATPGVARNNRSTGASLIASGRVPNTSATDFICLNDLRGACRAFKGAETLTYPALRILFVSYFCPPEVAAPASRVLDNASRLAAMGHEATILTGLPNHPMGRVFGGYRRRLFQTETMDDVRVVRVASWIAPNTTTANRMKSQLSLMMGQIIGGMFTGPADVVVGTSPPLFQALAGWVVSVFKRCPFVFEVRDLWPENVIAVGALKSGLGVRVLGRLERFLVRRASRLVVVTNGFADYYGQMGVSADRIAVVTNGVDLDEYRPAPYPQELARSLGLDGKFVAGYLGTVGINHGLLTILDAAERLRVHGDVAIVVVGDGAERASLEAEAARRGLDNVKFLGERPRAEMPAYHALCDAVMVLLKDAPYFRRVLPSKIFVCMGLERPIILGVDGEARSIVEEAGAGVFVAPENPEALAAAILSLRAMKSDGSLARMGRSGREFVGRRFDRNELARRLEAALRGSVEKRY
jgi:glycosyltransferase involved in cell wall biosynthesis